MKHEHENRNITSFYRESSYKKSKISHLLYSHDKKLPHCFIINYPSMHHCKFILMSTFKHH